MTAFLNFLNIYKFFIETIVATGNLLIFITSIYKTLKNKKDSSNNKSLININSQVNNTIHTTTNVNYSIPLTNNQTSSSNDGVLGLFVILLCVLTYSFFNKYYFSVAIVLSLLLSIKYIILRYWNFTQYLLPTIVSSISYSLTYFPPNNFWNNLSTNSNNINGFSDIINIIFSRLDEIIKKMFHMQNNYYQLTSILFTSAFSIFTLYILYKEITKPKNKIRINSWTDFIFYSILISVFLGFIYIETANNPLRIIVDKLITFFNN
ncbi:hypothetical protein ACSGFH_01800 [Streptococcus agalactiae]